MKLLLALLYLLFCASLSDALLSNPYNEIVLFGDSITQFSFDPVYFGLSASLGNIYQRKMDIVNRGFSGWNTDQALPVLSQLLPKVEDQRNQLAQIELLTIFFGANDAALPPSPQSVPLDRYKSNLVSMIKMTKDNSSAYYNPNLRVMLITPPPLNETLWKQALDSAKLPMDRSSASAQSYAAAVNQVGLENGVVVLDLWSKIIQQTTVSPNGTGDFLREGLYLNANGYNVLFDLMMETIKSRYPEIHPNNINDSFTTTVSS